MRVRRGCGKGVRLEENLCPNPEPGMETTDHLQGQWAFLVEHFRHPCTAAQVGLQITAAEATTFHIVFDGFDGSGAGML
jgi:hypothetical protein